MRAMSTCSSCSPATMARASGSSAARSTPWYSDIRSSACGAMFLPIRATATEEPNNEALSTHLTNRRDRSPAAADLPHGETDAQRQPGKCIADGEELAPVAHGQIDHGGGASCRPATRSSGPCPAGRPAAGRSAGSRACRDRWFGSFPSSCGILPPQAAGFRRDRGTLTESRINKAKVCAATTRPETTPLLHRMNSVIQGAFAASSHVLTLPARPATAR